MPSWLNNPEQFLPPTSYEQEVNDLMHEHGNYGKSKLIEGLTDFPGLNPFDIAFLGGGGLIQSGNSSENGNTGYTDEKEKPSLVCCSILIMAIVALFVCAILYYLFGKLVT